MYTVWLLGLLGLVTGILGQQSIGCYRSTTLDPDLTVRVAKRINSPEQCIKECKARYYMYSGLMNGYECYCDSRYGKHGPSSDCTEQCPSDPEAKCGSDQAINIWATDQTASSPPRHLEAIRSSQFLLEVTWQPPEIQNGKILSYTLKTKALNTHSIYPLPPTEIEVQGESSNSTILYGLHPGTKYNVTIFATNMNIISNIEGKSDETFTEAWTKIGPPNQPPVPKILSRNDQTITIEVPEGSSENGPLNFYYVVVVLAGTIAPTGSDVLYDGFNKAEREGTGYYITGKFDVADYPQYKKFVVGDGRLIGGYYNAPLNMSYFGIPRIGVALESRIGSEVQYTYSDLTLHQHRIRTRESQSKTNAANIILWILIILLSMLLVASVIFFVLLRKKFQQVQMQRLPESQELTLQGPLYEVDNMGYIPEEVPERANHYQELKTRVWSIPQNCLDFDPNYFRRGRFGTVHLGTVTKDSILIPAAVHKILDTQLSRSEKRKMLRELDVCIKAGTSKCLASLVGNCEVPETLFVAMEWPAQNLKQRLLASRSGNNFPYEQILKIGAGIADALRHLESLKILHTCVCTRSVGLENDWTPKLIGHGLSKYALEDVKYARWTAIECFSNQVKHNPGVVWAYGVLLWEMFSMGGTPYHNLEMDSDVEDAVNAGQRLQQLNDMPDSVYEVMNSCWLADPEERPTFDELVRLNTLSIIPITTITEPYRPELELAT